MVFFSAVHWQERVPGGTWGPGGCVHLYVDACEAKDQPWGQSSGAIHFQKKKELHFFAPPPPCLCLSVRMPQSTRMRKSEGSLWELVLSVHHVHPRD